MSTLIEMACNLIAKASNLIGMASNLIAMASNLLAMASNLIAIASNQMVMAFNLIGMATAFNIKLGKMNGSLSSLVTESVRDAKGIGDTANAKHNRQCGAAKHQPWHQKFACCRHGAGVRRTSLVQLVSNQIE